MKYAKLLNTEWDTVEFLGCDWPTIGNRKAVYDEIADKKKENLQSIEQLYNRLQTNFEKARRYSEAGDFYIGAQEMRRFQISRNSNKVWRWFRQNVLSIMALYRLVSLYGERYVRPLCWLAFFLTVFPIFYL